MRQVWLFEQQSSGVKSIIMYLSSKYLTKKRLSSNPASSSGGQILMVRNFIFEEKSLCHPQLFMFLESFLLFFGFFPLKIGKPWDLRVGKKRQGFFKLLKHFAKQSP